MHERFKRLHSPIKVRESLPPDLSSRLASAALFLIIGWGHTISLIGRVAKVVPRRTLIPGGATAFGMIVSDRNPGRVLGDIARSLHNTDVALDRQRYVQSSQSVAASQGANRVEVGVVSRNASKRQLAVPKLAD